MDKQKIKSVPRLTTDNPVNNFQTALNFTDVSEDGWVWLRRCVEQALQEELEVNDIQSGSHPPKLYYSSGVNVEDMIRVMSAVSAKMAAERGIKRVPLAVLSQSEISRRMSAI